MVWRYFASVLEVKKFEEKRSPETLETPFSWVRLSTSAGGERVLTGGDKKGEKKVLSKSHSHPH